MGLLSEKVFVKKVKHLRKDFEGTRERPRSIYVLKVKPEAFFNKRAKANRTFPSKKFPRLVEKPLGFVYVGLTGLSVEERFTVHASRSRKASKIAKLSFIFEGSFESVGAELTGKFGFKEVGWRDNKPEKLESWIAWNFYRMGYWVWGSHHHNDDKDFLGKYPFD